MKGFLKKIFPFLSNIGRKRYIKKKINMDIDYFRNNSLESSVDFRKIGYKILLDGHAIEKGMTYDNPRYFGGEKTKNIINYIELYEKNNWERDYAYNFGISILTKYCDYYKQNGWTDREEYIIVNKAIKEQISKLKTGVIEISRDDFISNALIDYGKFLESRHSFRKFEMRKINFSDMEAAVSMAIKTPTACNRQMCKVYFVDDEDVKVKILKYSHGLTGFDNETVNLIIISYDMSAFSFPKEFNQGMFNAGLFSMNLVNALHSIGIGSCFLEYSNDYLIEKENKKILNIPECEKIAVVIAAGYYPKNAIIPCSTRKPVKEILTKI